MTDVPIRDAEDMTERPRCELCGDPMPAGEEMFKFHGYSGPCPKPPRLLGREAQRVESETQIAKNKRRWLEASERADVLLAEIERLRQFLARANADHDRAVIALAAERSKRCGTCADARETNDGVSKRKCVSDASECYGWMWGVDHGCPAWRPKEAQ